MFKVGDIVRCVFSHPDVKNKVGTVSELINYSNGLIQFKIRWHDGDPLNTIWNDTSYSYFEMVRSQSCSKLAKDTFINELLK